MEYPIIKPTNKKEGQPQLSIRALKAMKVMRELYDMRDSLPRILKTMKFHDIKDGLRPLMKPRKTSQDEEQWRWEREFVHKNMFLLQYMQSGNINQQYEVICETYGMKEPLNMNELQKMKNMFETLAIICDKYIKYK
jgi:hypothetical protein